MLPSIPRDETELCPRGLCRGHHLHYHTVGYLGAGVEKYDLVGLHFRALLDLRGYLWERHFPLPYINDVRSAFSAYAHEELGADLGGGRHLRRLGDGDFDPLLDERRSDHEDDEEDQHHV